MEFDGAKYGFTNPAQTFIENDAFEYNEYAVKESWKATIDGAVKAEIIIGQYLLFFISFSSILIYSFRCYYSIFVVDK